MASLPETVRSNHMPRNLPNNGLVPDERGRIRTRSGSPHTVASRTNSNRSQGARSCCSTAIERLYQDGIRKVRLRRFGSDATDVSVKVAREEAERKEFCSFKPRVVKNAQHSRIVTTSGNSGLNSEVFDRLYNAFLERKVQQMEREKMNREKEKEICKLRLDTRIRVVRRARTPEPRIVPHGSVFERLYPTKQIEEIHILKRQQEAAVEAKAKQQQRRRSSPAGGRCCVTQKEVVKKPVVIRNEIGDPRDKFMKPSFVRMDIPQPVEDVTFPSDPVEDHDLIPHMMNYPAIAPNSDVGVDVGISPQPNAPPRSVYVPPPPSPPIEDMCSPIIKTPPAVCATPSAVPLAEVRNVSFFEDSSLNISVVSNSTPQQFIRKRSIKDIIRDVENTC